MSIHSAALTLALSERDAYRLALYAAMDALHEQQRELEKQRRELAETREAWARMARQVFGGDDA